MKNYLKNLGVTEDTLTISEKQFLDDNLISISEMILFSTYVICVPKF